MPYYSSEKNNWAGDNYSRYCNPDYDNLWQRSITELDPEKRRQMLIEMNDILVNNAVVIPLVHRMEAMGVSNNLQGVDLTPWDVNTWNIIDWKKVK